MRAERATFTRQVNFNRTKIGGNTKIEKLKWDILSDFQTVWGSGWWQFDMNIKAYFSSAIQTWNWIWNVSTVLGFLLCSTLALLFWWPLNLLFVLSRDNSLQQWGYFFTHYLSLIAFPRGSGNLKPEKKWPFCQLHFNLFAFKRSVHLSCGQ